MWLFRYCVLRRNECGGRGFTLMSRLIKDIYRVCCYDIRSKMYTCLKDEMERQERKKNFMTIPASNKGTGKDRDAERR